MLLATRSQEPDTRVPLAEGTGSFVNVPASIDLDFTSLLLVFLSRCLKEEGLGETGSVSQPYLPSHHRIIRAEHVGGLEAHLNIGCHLSSAGHVLPEVLDQG